MTIKLDPLGGSNISDTCREAAYIALWAEANPTIVAENDGNYVRLIPLFKMRERGKVRSLDEQPAGYEFLTGRKMPTENEEYEGQARFHFMDALREEYGSDGVPAANVILRYDSRGRALRTPYIDALIEGSSTDVVFTFNEADVVQKALSGSPKGTYENEVDLDFVSQLAGEMQAQWDATMKANHDAYWTPERKAESKRRQEESDKKMAARRAQTASAVAAFPFSPKPGTEEEYAEALAKNADPYGGRCYSYAADWASLMDQAIVKGSTVEACAQETSRMADYDGITGFMYGCAVSILSHFWERGDELRRWHNLDTQLGDEGEKANESGGVLNPALLSIG